MLKILIPLLTVGLVAQTPAPQTAKPPVPPGAGMPFQMPAPSPEPKADETIAFLGPEAIRYEDFTNWLKVMAGPRAEMVRKSAGSRNQAMKQYLDLRVLETKARQEKLENSKEFKETLAAFRQQCYVRTLMDEDRPGSDGAKLKAEAENPSGQEVLAYFNANRERWATPEKFTVRHILVSVKSAPGAGDKGLTDEEAKAKIAKIQAELKAGKKLQDLAKEYSDDPGSKNNGGLYQDIPFGRFAKEFEDAVRTQEIGKVGQPVKTQFGYHLIEVESITPKQEPDFAKVKDMVKKQMIPERREKLTKEYIDEARKEVKFREVPAAPVPAAMAPAANAAPAAAPAKP